MRPKRSHSRPRSLPTSHHVRHQLPIPRPILPRHNHALPYPRITRQPRPDLTHLPAEPTHPHPILPPPHLLQLPIAPTPTLPRPAPPPPRHPHPPEDPPPQRRPPPYPSRLLRSHQLPERRRRLVQHRHSLPIHQPPKLLRRPTHPVRHHHQSSPVQQRPPHLPYREIKRVRV